MTENRTDSEQLLDSLLASIENATNTIKGASRKPLTKEQLALMKELQSKLRNFKTMIDDYFADTTVQTTLISDPVKKSHELFF
jgi:hypothetical protein|tara:strand:+ start:212 stop:460 length:249 start_codon:yes stop_codon:yes gene_type:complete